MSLLSLRTLGDLKLTSTDGAVLHGRRKELTLLAYLARRSPRGVRRDELATHFWGERDETRARQSLRQALVHLRRAVGDVLEVGTEVRLLEDGIDVDSVTFERLITEHRFAEAVLLWGGDFLLGAENIGGETFRAWLDSEREVLRRRLAWTSARLVAEASEQGDWQRAATWGERWALAMPYDEDAHVGWIEALRLAGRVGEARARYASFLLTLENELTAEPGAAFEQLGRLLASESRASGRAESPGSALSRPEMIGRTKPFAQLVDAWRSVTTGQPAMVLIDGATGMGKTRLCAEFVRWLTSSNAHAVVLQANAERGSDSATARALLAPVRNAPGLSAAPDQSLADLSFLVPTLRERFTRLAEPDGSARAVSDALYVVLREISEEAPVLILIDDLPAADAYTRDLITSLVRRPLRAVMLVFTGPTHELAALRLPTEHSNGLAITRVTLQALKQPDIESLLAVVFQLSVADRVALSSQLHALSGGNPADLSELTNALTDSGVLVHDSARNWRIAPGSSIQSFPIPPGLRQSLRARADGVTPAARQLLAAAALFDSPADFALLIEVSGVRSDDVTLALEELLDRYLLRDAGGAYVIANESVRRYVSDYLPASRRQQLRRRRNHLGHPLRRWARGIAVLVATVLIVAVGARVASRNTKEASPTTIAILPFAVRGGAEYQYLSEGMVDLLSTKLEGAGGLHAVDPHALLSFLDGRPARSLAPDNGKAVAQRFGAGLFVLGSIVAAAGRLDVSASLYNANGQLIAQAGRVAEGEAKVFDVVDELARQLLSQRDLGPGAQLTRLAGVTTSSFPALKAYLEGESALRLGKHKAGVEAFQRAVEYDSTFALAYHRLGMAASWMTDNALARDAANHAARYGARLPSSVREALDASVAWRHGDVARAERLYREITSADPNNVAAWFELGDLRYHYNSLLGRSKGDAREAFEHVLRLDRRHGESLVHLFELSAWEGQIDEIDAKVATLDSTSDFRKKWPVLRALLSQDSAQAAQLVNQLRGEADHALVRIVVHSAAGYAHNPAGSARLVRLLTDPARDPGWRAYGHYLLAQLALAQGNWSVAKSELRRLEVFDSTTAVEYGALWATIPFLRVPNSELAQYASRLRGWQPAQLPKSQSTIFSVHDELHPQLQLYLLGLLSARLGRLSQAVEYASELEKLGSPPDAAFLTPSLARSVRAQVLALRSGPGAALAELGDLRSEQQSHVANRSAIYNRVYERFMRAEFLAQAGLAEAAIAEYSAAADYTITGLAYLQPSRFRRGQLYEAIDSTARAVEYFARFTSHWSQPDASLQPWTHEARTRLARLRPQMVRE